MNENTDCHFADHEGNIITECVICGVEISAHTFQEIETLRGDIYTIQVLECKKCGSPSFGWTRKKRWGTEEDDSKGT